MTDFEDCIKSDGESMEVDWENFRKLEDNGNQNLYKNVSDILVKTGVMSDHSKGNYGVIGEGILLNPKRNIFSLYFTKKEDAIKYGKTYKDCNYSIKPIYFI